MNYYNTTNVKGEELKARTEKTKSQRDIILDVFRRYPNYSFTPFEIHTVPRLRSAPITSIRRAITDLTTEGKLFKCPSKREGKYGATNYTWTLNSPGERGDLKW